MSPAGPTPTRIFPDPAGDRRDQRRGTAGRAKASGDGSDHARGLHAGGRWSGLLLIATMLATTACSATTARATAAEAAAPATSAVPAAPTAPTTRQDPPPAVDADAIAFTRGVLLDPGTAEDLRRTAVERLARDGSPPAIAALGEAIAGDELAIVSTTLQALGQMPEAGPALLEPLLEPMLAALAKAPAGLLDPLGLLLARLDQADRAAVRAMATDAGRPPTERLAAIHVLGVLATIESGDSLVALLDPARTEDPAIRRAAREALVRMMGRDLGADHAAWTNWWNDARRRGLADWWREIRRRDREQIARLQSELDALAARHVELLRQLYAGFNDATPSPREIELLLVHLADPAPAVRRFAVERIERLVRDSVPIPAPLLEPIIARLDDESGPIRTAAVRLLDEAGLPDLGDRLIARLPSEPDPATASAMLEVLGRGARPEAADAVIARLDVPATAAAAARATWMLARAGSLSDAARTRAAELAARRLESDPAAADQARLLASIGSPETLTMLVGRLAPETPAAMVTAIAEGLASAGTLAPLLERSDLPAVRPVLIGALADGEASETRLEQLMALAPAPDAENRRAWETAVARLARRLPAHGVLAVDARMLSGPDPTALERRRLMLVPAATAATTEGREDAVDTLRAAAGVLLDLGRPADAWSLIESAGISGTDEKLRAPRIRAALLTGRYDEAAAADGDPNAWLAALQELLAQIELGNGGEAAARATETARRLSEEITRRFNGGLDEAQQASLARMIAAVSPPPPAPTPAPPPTPPSGEEPGVSGTTPPTGDSGSPGPAGG
jgi:hypothetical protein